MLRELAWLDVESEPMDDDQTQMMTDEQFEEEVELAKEGRWDELELDELPDDWQAATVEDLRGARA